MTIQDISDTNEMEHRVHVRVQIQQQQQQQIVMLIEIMKNQTSLKPLVGVDENINSPPPESFDLDGNSYVHSLSPNIFVMKVKKVFQEKLLSLNLNLDYPIMLRRNFFQDPLRYHLRL